MKFIALILSIYILALNFTPCEDSEAINNNDTSTVVEMSQSLTHNHSDSDFDSCSPFCQCYCCHIQVTYFNLDEITVISNHISTEVFTHFSSLGKDIPNSILQPPRV